MLSKEIILDLQRQLDKLPHGQRGAFIKEQSEKIGCHVATLRRKLSQGSKSINRSKNIPQKWIDAVGYEKVATLKMGPKARMISTDKAIQLCEEFGTIPKGVLNRSTVDRRLKESGFWNKRTYTRHEDKYVNQVHYLDWSRSDYFEAYQRKEDGTWLLKMDGRVDNPISKNKPDDGLYRLWVSALVDSYSRATLMRYHVQTGENIYMLTEFLQFAWQRENADHPMFHLPEIVKMDHGAMGRSKVVKERLEEYLDIEIQLTKSKSNRLTEEQSGGKVEVKFKDLFKSAEIYWARRMQKQGQKIITLEELNEWAYAHCLEILDRQHPRMRTHTIREVYMKGIRQRPQKTAPKEADLDLLFYKEDTRTADATGLVSIDNVFYKVPEEFHRQKIRILIKDGHLMGQSMDRQRTFALETDYMTPGTKSRKKTYREQIAELPEVIAQPIREEERVANVVIPKANVITLVPRGETKEFTTPLSPEVNARLDTYFQTEAEMKGYVAKAFGMPWKELKEWNYRLVELIEFAWAHGKATKELMDELRSAV